jgi:hypothetical protein
MANSPNTPPSYLDFEIEIGLGQGREYPLAAVSFWCQMGPAR